MSDDRANPLVPLVHVLAYLGLSFVWVVVVGLFTAFGVAATMGLDAMGSEAAVEDAIGAGGMGVLTIVQIVGLGAAALLLASVLPREGRAVFDLPRPGELGEHLRAQLALRPAPLGLLVAAAVGALTVWTFPSWMAEQLIGLLPEGASSSLEMLVRLLESATPGGRTILLVAIVVSAPVFEEVIFRGYLWSAFARAAPEWVAMVATTLLFALYHLDPVHVVSLLPTALFLGWLRWSSGSLWPPMLAHFVNNSVAAVVTVVPAAQEAESLSAPAAIAGAVFTIACAAAGWWLARPSASREATP